MSEWSLTEMLTDLHCAIHQRLDTARRVFGHPGTKGDASETVWLDLLATYLPKRYQVKEAHVVDSQGEFSEQIDVVVFDRQYSPFIFNFGGQTIIPVESVYAILEAKQTLNAHHVRYARKKVESVRRLYRTTLPIPHAGGIYEAKAPIHIYGGLLTLDSDWNPALGESLLQALGDGKQNDRLDIGCVAAHGYFNFDPEISKYEIHCGGKPATSFLFELISQLQRSATVPMLDVRAYAKWIAN